MITNKARYKRWWELFLYAFIAFAIILGLAMNGDLNITTIAKSYSSTISRIKQIYSGKKGHKSAPVINSQLDPRVTQNTIRTTIALPGWTDKVRIPEGEAHRIKKRKIWEHGYTDSSKNYELDHFIPLGLGGSSDPSNLWVEPIGEAIEKDKLERRLHNEVISGHLTLKQAQQIIRDRYHIY